MSAKRPAWWPSAEQKQRADAACAARTPAPLPVGLRWVAGGTALGGCNDGHIAIDDDLRGTLCGRVHGGSTHFGPRNLADACGSCLRVAGAKHGLTR